MWRTLFLLAGFAFFINQSARYGDIALAANHILLQFISFAAFFLDGFAFAAESLVGSAIGARNKVLFDRVVLVSTQLAAVTAVGLTLLVLFVGQAAIKILTSIASVQIAATDYLPHAAIYILFSFAAFQLDGIFVGAAHSRAMRNASFLALMFFLLFYFFTPSDYSNHGLWAAFIAYVIARACALGYYYPSLVKNMT